MHDQQFDDLARRLALAHRRLVSRRTLLHVAAVAGAAVVVRGIAPGAFAQAGTPIAAPRKLRPSGGPSVEQKAFDLEYDIDKMFRFVADDVRYEPYPGVLRGAKGTLWGLAGNSADQALLLAALLEQDLVQIRFVVGALADADAERLLAATTIDAAALQADAQRLYAPAATPASAPAALTPEQQDFLDRAQALRPKLLATVKAQRDANLATLTDGLRQAGVALDPGRPQLPERERTQHVWLQYAAGADWVDLDPVLPGAEPGKAYATPSATLDALPDDAYHKIALRAVAEIVSGGQPSRQTILTYDANSADLVGRTITFVQSKPQWLGATLNEAIGGQVQYDPYLIVDDQTTRGTGTLAFGTATGLAGALGGGSSIEGEPIGEWLEIDIVAPDAPVQTETREIFDRIGIAQRTPGADLTAAIAALAPAELIDVPNAGATFAPFVGATNIAVVSSHVPASYFEQDRTIDDQNADLALYNHGFHLLRDVLHAEMAAETGLRFYHDRPSVTFFQLGATHLTAASATLVVGLDLVAAAMAG
ncbi:MAG TPA: hypothetical protein VFQ80_08355, partial [Thermomicrobiales bacterium]|nr:hypothetical protein [Thermomicrobiales bacterium]